MIAWERDGRILHPFGDQIAIWRYGPCETAPSIAKMLDVAARDINSEWGVAVDSMLIRLKWIYANTFDPFLHQAIFHFLRGQSLLGSKFEAEAVVAFDCVLQSLKGLLMRGGLANSGTSWGDVCRKLRLGKRAAEVADRGYFVRNNFGAHAGGWRWWDHWEMAGELAPALAGIARRALHRASVLERSIRVIDPEPSDWPAWLLANFNMVWDVVWFDQTGRSLSRVRSAPMLGSHRQRLQ